MPVLTVNGVDREFSDAEFPATLSSLIKTLELAVDGLVAEVDGKIVRKHDFPQTTLISGSSVELVQFVGGG